MGPGMVNMMIASAKELYPDDPEKQIELCQNHCVFFNTQPTVGIIVPGLCWDWKWKERKRMRFPMNLSKA